MGNPFCLPENLKIVEAISPAADAGGRSSDVVSLKNALMAWIVIHITQGNAATVALTPMQATDVAAATNKVLSQNAKIWADLDCAVSDAFVRLADAKNYTTDAGVKHKQIIFQIDPAELDVAGGYDCLYFTTGASNAANITEAQFYILERYAASTPPSAIVD
jgi:hypothetical protein